MHRVYAGACRGQRVSVPLNLHNVVLGTKPWFLQEQKAHLTAQLSLQPPILQVKQPVPRREKCLSYLHM